MLLEKYKDKTVLVTGHTGFKGSWLCTILKMAGAKVIGYSLMPSTEPNLFNLAEVDSGMVSIIGDICDLKHLDEIFQQYQPEYIFHLAAQPLVREGYKKPLKTYETNVMGTVNLLECVRKHMCVKSVLNVTTDKVYKNKEQDQGYCENEILDGFDPYSNSKSCSELVTHSYKNSFFQERDVRVSTARAGNVIGGGDFAEDRILPDCVRAAMNHENIVIRNPDSIRPYQHVLEPLAAYLMIASMQLEDKRYESYYNVGPEETDCLTTGELTRIFCERWGNGLTWRIQQDNGPHEARLLKLDCSKIKSIIGWKSKWTVKIAVEKTVDWIEAYESHNIINCMEQQIREYFNE